ncbi:MAG: histidinol-phosphate aminotransferase family protein [Acidobacteria bacterium]|nr:histidinol-phosphate aminotransferase family protein [Acidobacteriota bacterium]
MKSTADWHSGSIASQRIHGGLTEQELRIHGLSCYEVLDFSVNINPLGPPLSAMEALASLDPARYPDPHNLRLREAISVLNQVPAEQIVIGNGSTELIHLSADLLLSDNRPVVIMAPTFGEYECAVRKRGAEVHFFEASCADQFRWDMEGALQGIPPLQPSLIFLCNPNNPTGVYLSRQDVERLISAVAPVMVVLDESYACFAESRWVATDLLVHSNVIILRSLTKEYALAGLRVGYAMASEQTCRGLHSLQPSWSVNAAAQAAALAALDEDDYTDKSRRCIQEAKYYLRQELERIGFSVYDSAANFLLVEAGDAPLLRILLLQQGICVRDCSSFGLPQYIRVGIRTMKECAHLVEALEEISRASFADPCMRIPPSSWEAGIFRRSSPPNAENLPAADSPASVDRARTARVRHL